jgi:hypothetical protein
MPPGVRFFFKPGEASPRQQAWQPALRTHRVTSGNQSKNKEAKNKEGD